MSHKVWHANESSMLNGHERRVCQHLQRFTSNGGVSIMSGTLLKGQKELTIFSILLQNIYVDFFRFVTSLLITPNIFMQFSNGKSIRKIFILSTRISTSVVTENRKFKGNCDSNYVHVLDVSHFQFLSTKGLFILNPPFLEAIRNRKITWLLFQEYWIIKLCTDNPLMKGI